MNLTCYTLRYRAGVGKTPLLARLAPLACATGLGLAQLTAPAAVAEETGMVIHLSYVRGYSNWGPTNVYGTARLWPHEGVALITVHALPHLLDGDTYVSWIVNTKSGEAVRLGAFNTSEAGDGSQDVIFNQSPPQGADALVVTVLHPHDPTILPGPQRSLAGYFAPLAVAPAPTPPADVGGSGNRVQPDPHPTSGTRPRTPPAAPRSGHHADRARSPIAPAEHTARRMQNATPPHVVVALPRTGGGPQARRAAERAARENARHRHAHRRPPPRAAALIRTGRGKD